MATTKFITIRSEAGIKNNARYIKNPNKTTLNNDDETLDKIQASLLNEEEDISESDSGHLYALFHHITLILSHVPFRV